MDSNGDGIGDLQGIIQRLDYLAELGVDALWLSPIYPSPMADFGYDVSDYTGIHPMFGDLATFDRLLSEAHTRGLKVILDFVPNHSSDQHPWFLESRSSRDNPKRDWYFWRDPKPDGSLPNNWVAVFGGKAWEWDEKTGQYYLHSFLVEQPDLNWFNPQVRETMKGVMRFWLDRGVDGFRIDVVHFILKHPDLPDNPPPKQATAIGKEMGDFDTVEHVYDINYPDGRQELVRLLRGVVDEYDSRIVIGETYIMEMENLMPFYGEHLDGLHMPFNFTLLHLPWNQTAFRKALQTYYDALPEGAQPNFVIGSHDEHRFATRYGRENARSAGLLLLTLRGTPTIYYGDELGMESVPIPPEKIQDPLGKYKPEVGRDDCRTPMQWDATPNAGFSRVGVEPWLPISADYQTVNVAVEREDVGSTLNFYKRLLKLRREMPALHRGDLTFLDGTPEDVMAYTRYTEGVRLLVVINFGDQAPTLDLSRLGSSGDILLDTRTVKGRRVELARLALQPHEGMLIRVG
jgi:alpha-glucosidase